MPHDRPTRRQRPMVAFLVTTAAASVAALITALWSTTSLAATLAS
jgi:hypothetical protein